MKNKLTLGGSTLGTQVQRPDSGAGTLAKLVGSAQSKSSSAGYYVRGAANPQSDGEVLEGYLDSLYAVYKPEKLVYTEQTAEELRAQIEAWLRPSYDQAILNRQTRTGNYRAELDADAISRGMGSSSYVTDVKSRQMQQEAEDVATLEGEYGAALAKTLSERLSEEKERAQEIDMFNAENDHDAYMRAYQAALTMFAAYKAKGGGSGGGYYVSGGDGVTPTTAENCEAFLSLLSPEERTAVYSGSGAEGEQYRRELIASVGMSGYYTLMGKYAGSR